MVYITIMKNTKKCARNSLCLTQTEHFSQCQ